MLDNWLNLKQTKIKCKISAAERTYGQTQKNLPHGDELKKGNANKSGDLSQLISLENAGIQLLLCWDVHIRGYYLLQSLSSDEIGAEEAAYPLFILLLHLQLNSALSWTDENTRLLERKISRLRPPWTRSIYRLHLYILISLPYPSCMHREVQSIHAHLHKTGTRAGEWCTLVWQRCLTGAGCQGRGKVEALSIVHSWNMISDQLFQGSMLWIPPKPSMLPTNP